MKLFDAKKYRGQKICVALSGGVDSVCLLHTFREQAAEYDITLSAIHIEHGIRGETALRDLAFCEQLCAAWGIPLEIVRADIPALARQSGRGLEAEGRTFRYAAFSAVVQEGRADIVATAHHKGDVAETILFRLARGTSPAGMRAITERAGIIRPLLGVTRAELEAYAERNGLYHVEDETNADEHYTRNYIRHTALPAFAKIANGAEEHLVRFAFLAAQDDAYLTELARGKISVCHGERAVPVDLPDPLFSRACIICMETEHDYRGANLEEISKLKSLQSGKRICLPAGMQCAREQNFIVFYRSGKEERKEFPFAPVYGEFGVFSISQEETEGALRIDLDAFPNDCIVRTRREGDVITPYHGRSKTLKKFLTDRKIPARPGQNLPVIAHGSEILVVVGVEIADGVKVTGSTVRTGYIR